MLIVTLLILLLLIGLFVQDMVSRSVYWITFPILTILYILSHILAKQQLIQWLPGTFKNVVFLTLQFAVIWIYFSIKARRPVNITAGLIGWGDILFLVSLAFYLSLLNFIIFYLSSLMVVLLTVFVRSFFLSDKKIPLAGLQALIFALFLTCNCLFFHWNLMSDDKLLQYFIKWA